MLHMMDMYIVATRMQIMPTHSTCECIHSLSQITRSPIGGLRWPCPHARGTSPTIYSYHKYRTATSQRSAHIVSALLFEGLSKTTVCAHANTLRAPCAYS